MKEFEDAETECVTPYHFPAIGGHSANFHRNVNKPGGWMYVESPSEDFVVEVTAKEIDAADSIEFDPYNDGRYAEELLALSELILEKRVYEMGDDEEEDDGEKLMRQVESIEMYVFSVGDDSEETTTAFAEHLEAVISDNYDIENVTVTFSSSDRFPVFHITFEDVPEDVEDQYETEEAATERVIQELSDMEDLELEAFECSEEEEEAAG
jgi:hypothetical protein